MLVVHRNQVNNPRCSTNFVGHMERQLVVTMNIARLVHSSYFRYDPFFAVKARKLRADIWEIIDYIVDMGIARFDEIDVPQRNIPPGNQGGT